jgi:hypothetical protein
MHTKPNVQTLRRSVGIGFLSIESGKRDTAPRSRTYSKDARICNSNEDQQEPWKRQAGQLTNTCSTRTDLFTSALLPKA